MLGVRYSLYVSGHWYDSDIGQTGNGAGTCAYSKSKLAIMSIFEIKKINVIPVELDITNQILA